MSVEKGNIAPSSIFPVGLDSAVGAYVWMRDNLEDHSKGRINPESQEQELTRLRAKQPRLFLFLDQMRDLRGTTMLSPENRNSYYNGLIFMARTLENHYRAQKQGFPFFGEACLIGYFQDLIDVENNHFEISLLKEAQGIEEKDPFFPSSLNSLILSGFAPENQLHRVTETFIISSENAAHKVCDDEEFGRKIMLKGELANRYGPIKGFAYGATDLYACVERFEKAKQLRRLLRAGVK